MKDSGPALPTRSASMRSGAPSTLQALCKPLAFSSRPTPRWVALGLRALHGTLEKRSTSGFGPGHVCVSVCADKCCASLSVLHSQVAS